MAVVSPWEHARHDAAPTVGPEGTQFVGRRLRLFWLSFRLGLLTVLTLGIYRFWMKTRLRRWYWSAVRPLGMPLEYTGDPLEKLLGFLIAVTFLAFYIGVVNLLLMFASFSLFQGNVAAYVLSFVGVIPIWFFARYRARRYVLARTRWRGIRFGLAPGAWGYAGRALWHWVLTILSLGLLWPRKAFYLEKYITDRTYFGAASLHQAGSWRSLMRPFLGIWMPVAMGAALTALVFFLDVGLYGETPVVAVIGLLIWLIWGVVNYYVKSLRYLTQHKQVAGAGMEIAPRSWRVFGIFFLGYGLASLVAFVLLIPIGVLGVVMSGMLGPDPVLFIQSLATMPRWILSVAAVSFYFLLFLSWSTLVHAFVRMPLWRHLAETFVLTNPEVLADVRQRPRDEFGEAEGFAEALDVGAAI